MPLLQGRSPGVRNGRNLWSDAEMMELIRDASVEVESRLS